MKLEQLIYLVEISKNKSMRQASENLFLTPQALNLSVQTLENEFNTQILNRTYQGVTFTAQGLEILNFAKDTLNNYNNLKASLDGKSMQDTSLKGDITIYSSSFFVPMHLAQTINNFHAVYPNVTVSVIEHDSKSTLQLMNEHTLQNSLGILFLPQMLSENNNSVLAPHLKFKEVYNGNYCIFANKQSLIAKHKQISVATLLKNPIILYTDNMQSNTFLLDIMNKYGEPNIILKTSSFDLIYQALEQDLAPVVFHDILASELKLQNKFNNFTTIKMKEKFNAPFGYLYKKENTSPIIRKFLEFLPIFTQV